MFSSWWIIFLLLVFTASSPLSNNVTDIVYDTLDNLPRLAANLTERTYSVSFAGPAYTYWPPGGGGTTTIQYTFEDADTKQDIGVIAYEALQLWTDTLNSYNMPTSLNFHGAGYLATLPDGSVNPQLDKDIVVFQVNANEVADSSLGYMGHETEPFGGPWEYYIQFDPSVYSTHQSAVASFAHEWGHILGLVHEHQRMDRDFNVNFHCDRLVKWTDANQELSDAVAEGQQDVPTIQAICSDFGVAMDHPTLGSIHWVILPDRPDMLVTEDKYDLSSIMHYSSFQGSKGPAADEDPNNPDIGRAVLTRKDPDHPGGELLIQKNMVPSKQDCERIAILYAPEAATMHPAALAEKNSKQRLGLRRQTGDDLYISLVHCNNRKWFDCRDVSDFGYHIEFEAFGIALSASDSPRASPPTRCLSHSIQNRALTQH